jgi:hypothetical protein
MCLSRGCWPFGVGLQAWRWLVAKLSTQLTILSIGESRFNWFNPDKSHAPDEYARPFAQLEKSKNN